MTSYNNGTYYYDYFYYYYLFIYDDAADVKIKTTLPREGDTSREREIGGRDSYIVRSNIRDIIYYAITRTLLV